MFGNDRGITYKFEKPDSCVVPGSGAIDSGLFYLGRLVTGQDCLDKWTRHFNKDKLHVLYEVEYKKKTLERPAKKKKKAC